MVQVAKWREFVEQEALRFEGKTGVRFATSAGRVARYLQFVDLLADIYRQVGEAAAATHMKFFEEPFSTPGPLPPECLDLVNRSAELGRLVQLQVESFFLFAKILLDTTALFIEDCFGAATEKHRIKSHGGLLKRWVEYGKAKGIIYPAGFEAAVMATFDLVCTFRNKQIAHQEAAEVVRAASYSTGALPALATVPLFPKKGDQRIISPDLGTVERAIDDYLALVRELIVTNWARSTYQALDIPALTP